MKAGGSVVFMDRCADHSIAELWRGKVADFAEFLQKRRGCIPPRGSRLLEGASEIFSPENAPMTQSGWKGLRQNERQNEWIKGADEKAEWEVRLAGCGG